jgi:hypothetical protein
MVDQQDGDPVSPPVNGDESARFSSHRGRRLGHGPESPPDRADLISAIRDQDTMRLQKLLNLHHQDTVRVT